MVKKVLAAGCIFLSMACVPAHAIDISAEAACVISADTGEIIFAKNENERRSMASTTKIMTGLLAAESGRLDDYVTVSANAQNQEGSSIYLRTGDKVILSDLLYGLMLNSGNDAAVAIAEYLSGDVESFSEGMTARAKELGAKNTSFKNPNGLEQEGHYTTAYDLAVIGAEAMKNDIFKTVVSTKSKTATLENGQILYFTNHNKLLKTYDGADGIKTGFTKAAGRCLVSAAQRNGASVVAVTLNAPNDWNDHKALLDYAFENIKVKTIVKKGEILKRIKKGGREYTFSAAEAACAGTVSGKGFEVKVYLPRKLPEPIAAGEKAGYAEILKDGKYVKKIDIISDSDIFPKENNEKKTLPMLFKKVIKVFL